MAEARAADDVYLFGGGGETLAGRTGKEASSLLVTGTRHRRLGLGFRVAELLHKGVPLRNRLVKLTFGG